MKATNLKPYHSNKNIPKKVTSGKVLYIDEMFYSIQSEGPFSGIPAYFIRLWGCNLNCSFCDTTQKKRPRLEYKVKDIVALMKEKCPVNNVVITGGEPALQDTSQLVAGLIAEGFWVQVETNGTLPHRNIDYTCDKIKFVVSPKTAKVDKELAEHAAAFKYVVSVDNLNYKTGIPNGLFLPKCAPQRIMLSPMFVQDDPEKTQKNIQLVISVCKNTGYWFTLQYHKLIGIE